MKLVIIVIGFIMGLIFCYTQRSSSFYENFEDSTSCPNMLVRKGEKLHLINTRALKVPGVNPIIFNNLEEYEDYFKFQKSQGINCPVLYFQETYDAQNRAGYRLLANPLEPHGGLNLTKPGKKGGIGDYYGAVGRRSYNIEDTDEEGEENFTLWDIINSDDL